MSLQVQHRGGTRYDITSGPHTVVTDQPMEDGGSDAGMSPVDLFVGSLASCVAYFVGRYCARHQISCDGFTVEADWTMVEQPHRVGAIALRIRLPENLNPSERERLLRVAHGCTVHQSLVVPAQVDIELRTPASAGLR